MLGTDHASVLLQDKCIFPWRVLVQYRAEFPVQFPYHFVLQEYMMVHVIVLQCSYTKCTWILLSMYFSRCT